ncbi:MAG: type IV toxin-antitoxin system AbiEi family antitoxin domain-containing protein [Pseudobdellovibrionaceae bacterium]
MNTLKRLESQFEKDPFSLDDIKRLGITDFELNKLLKEEAIYRLSRGVYVLAGTDLSDEALFRSATLRIEGPSAVCLLSALAFYGLTDHIPKKVWLLVPENKHTTHKDIRPLRSRKPQWKVGIERNVGFNITNIERSIIDALVMKRILGVQIGVGALKSALKEKKTTLGKILKMAKLLGVDHRIMIYIEALA